MAPYPRLRWTTAEVKERFAFLSHLTSLRFDERIFSKTLCFILAE